MNTYVIYNNPSGSVTGYSQKEIWEHYHFEDDISLFEVNDYSCIDELKNSIFRVYSYHWEQLVCIWPKCYKPTFIFFSFSYKDTKHFVGFCKEHIKLVKPLQVENFDYEEYVNLGRTQDVIEA